MRFKTFPRAPVESHKSLRESSGSCCLSLFAPRGAIQGSAKWLSKYQHERNKSGITGIEGWTLCRGLCKGWPDRQLVYDWIKVVPKTVQYGIKAKLHFQFTLATVKIYITTNMPYNYRVGLLSYLQWNASIVSQNNLHPPVPPYNMAYYLPSKKKKKTSLNKRSCN